MGVELPAPATNGAVPPGEAASPSRSPSQTAPEDLRAQPVVRYATTEDAARYRRIMRVLFLEHQAFGLRLRPDQVAERLRERFGLREATELLESDWRDSPSGAPSTGSTIPASPPRPPSGVGTATPTTSPRPDG